MEWNGYVKAVREKGHKYAWGYQDEESVNCYTVKKTAV